MTGSSVYKRINKLFGFLLFVFIFLNLFFAFFEISLYLDKEQIYVVQKINFIVLYLTSIVLVYIIEYFQGRKLSVIFLFYAVFGLFLGTNIIFDGIGDIVFGKISFFKYGIFSIETRIEIIKVLIMSLIGLNTGYILSTYFSKHEKISINLQPNDFKSEIFSKFSLLIFIPCFFATVYKLYIKTMYALQNGYVSLYTDYASYQAPGIINFLDTFTFAALIIFLIYSNNKKIKNTITTIYLLTILVSMVGGARAEAMTQILVLISCYAIMYREKFKIIYILVGIMLLIIFAQGISFARNDIVIDDNRNIVIDFLAEQGGSYNTIGYTIDYYDSFEDDYRNGVLYAPIIGFVKTTLKLQDDPIAIEKATDFTTGYGYSYGLSYKINPSLYLSGYGIGSSYISEVLITHGKSGVLLINIFISIFIIFLQKKSRTTKLALFIFLIMAEQIFFMPRSSLFGFLPYLLRPLLLYFGIYFMYLLKYKGDK